MGEKQVIVTLEDGFGRVQTSIATSLSAPQLMDKIMEIDEQQATIDMQELRLQQLEELLELSENLNKSYREKLIDMNLNNAFLESKITTLEQENEQLKKRNKFLEEFDGQAKTVANLKEENEQLKQKIKHCVYVDVDNANGCMNCKYDEGSICSILDCGTHDYLEGVSECGLKYWEYKDE